MYTMDGTRSSCVKNTLQFFFASGRAILFLRKEFRMGDMIFVEILMIHFEKKNIHICIV